MLNWPEISNNPNAPAVLSYRISELKKARAPLITNRVPYLCDLVRDKDVLDIGVVEHNIDAIAHPNWLHRRLSDTAKSIIGADILDHECGKLRDMGFNVICVDLTETSLDRTFDVIVMGDVIEHLDRVGPLLSNSAKMIRPNGRIVITTPNPWYINPVLKSFRKTPFTDSADHVAWFDAATLMELGRRHNLTLESYRPIQHTNIPTIKARALIALIRWLTFLGMNDALLAKTMLYEFVQR